MSSSRYRYRISEPVIGRPELDAVNRCLLSGELTMTGGRSVTTFEDRLAGLLNVDPDLVVACSSGTAALHLAVLDAGWGPGYRVVVPGLTYVASVAALRYVGATPVFVDVEPDTWTVDPAAVRALAPTCADIIPVDLYGQPALSNLTDRDLWAGKTIIQDCCQSLGLTAREGATSVYSFYANKLITTGGEGGAVVALNRVRASAIRQLRGQGQSPDRRYWHTVIGYNYRMTAMQAAFGIAQFIGSRDFLLRRRLVADVYRDQLRSFRYPTGNEGTASVDWLFSLLIPADCDRSKVAAYLAGIHGIETRPVFPNIARMPPYREWAVDLPVTDDIADRGISLPTHPLLTPDDASIIARAFIEAVNHSVTKIQKGA